MMQQTRFHTTRRSLLAQIINRVGNVFLLCGIPLISLSEDSLLRTARRRTGLSDLGGYFSNEGFQILLHSLEKNGNLHLLGRRGIRRECLRLLSNNLRIQEDLHRYPEIMDSPILLLFQVRFHRRCVSPTLKELSQMTEICPEE